MSNSTSSLGEEVKNIIDRDPVIRNGLARELVNIRALARYMQIEHGVTASIDAIISAVRRLPVKESAIKINALGKLILKLTMKNRIVDVAILNDPEIPRILSKFSGEIDYGRGETYRIVAGVDTVRLVIDEKNLSKLTSLMPKKSIRNIAFNLSEIIVLLDESTEKTPGVLAVVAEEVAIKGINIVEFMSCIPELIIVIDERDALSCYESLQRLSKSGRR